MVKESPVASETLLGDERSEAIKEEANLLHQMRLIFLLKAIVELVDATTFDIQHSRVRTKDLAYRKSTKE